MLGCSESSRRRGLLTTGIVYHDAYLSHNLGDGHPERPERIQSILKATEEIFKRTDVILFEPKPASTIDLLRVHTEDYVAKVRRMSETGGVLTMDTPVPPGVYQTARLAVGGAMLAGESVVQDKVDNAFALTRPPGHHAGRAFGGGFCFFNNVAIMIEYLRFHHHLRRFAILDWDVHHGNGTQDIFDRDAEVFYFSTHQSPLYPGTGRIEQIGEGPGRGSKINVPLPSGTSGGSFKYILAQLFAPLLKQFRPELIAVSAGYDAYFDDPLANLSFTIETYSYSTKFVKDLAHDLCGGRLVVVLEGGYNLRAVSQGVFATLSSMLDLGGVEEPSPVPPQIVDESVLREVSQIKQTLSSYWDIS